MSASLKSATSSQLLDNVSPFRRPPRGSFFFRPDDRQQKIDRHTEGARELLMKNDRPLALFRFEVRQIPLRNADTMRQFCLRHIAPFAQHADRILACRQTINNRLWQQNFAASRHSRSRLTNQAGGANVLVRRQSRKALILGLGQNGEFLAAGGLDELDLIHEDLSVINLSAVSNGNDDQRVSFDIENNAPVADAQSCAIPTLQPLYVALPCLRERRELCLKPSSHVDGETKPLSRGRRCPDDVHHQDIANRNIIVNQNIAYCDIPAIS